MTYVCPMHSEIRSQKKGHCPKCGMELVPEDTVGDIHQHVAHSVTSDSWKDYTPLLVVIGFILLTTLIFSYLDFQDDLFSLSQSISYFMTGFFLTFSAFKFMDLKGFAAGYSTYDLLAKRWFGYGYMYPFIELFFAIAMIIGLFPQQVITAEIIIMSFSGLGVALKLLKHEKFQCACLGTFLKVPLTKVTLIEDFGMAILGILVLALH